MRIIIEGGAFMNIKPLFDRVVIKNVEAEETTSFGFFAESARDPGMIELCSTTDGRGKAASVRRSA